MDKNETNEAQFYSNSKAIKSGSTHNNSKRQSKAAAAKINKSNIIVNNFVLVKEIGKGAFGEIYLTYNKRDNIQVATKKETKTFEGDNKLKIEALIYQKLLNIKKQDLTGENIIIQDEELGIPKLYGAGETSEFNYLIIDFLGPNLLDLLKICKRRKLTISTVSLLGLQIINRIEYLHNHNYIHRDIKPENFLIGTQEKSNIIFLIDYGLSKRYRVGKNNQHIPYKEDKSLIGTARYVSINTHFGIEQSRRDDLESIGYILIFFLKGSLPWQGLKGSGRFQSILEKKLQIPTELLCQGLPEEMTSYLNYCKSLHFEDHPDYDYLRSLFISILGKCTSVYGLSKANMKFDWCYKDQDEIWGIFNKGIRKTTLCESPNSHNNKSCATSQNETPTNSVSLKNQYTKKKSRPNNNSNTEFNAKEPPKQLSTITEKGINQNSCLKEQTTLKSPYTLSNGNDGKDERIIISTKSERDNAEDDNDNDDDDNESDKTQKCSFHIDKIKIVPQALITAEEDKISNYISKILIKGSTKSNSSSRDHSNIIKKYSLKEKKSDILDENECHGTFDRAKTFYKAQTPQFAPKKTHNLIEGQLNKIKTIRGGSNCYLHSKLKPCVNKVIWDHYNIKPIDSDTLLSSNMTKILISKRDQKEYSLYKYSKEDIDYSLTKCAEFFGLMPIYEMIADAKYCYFIIGDINHNNILQHFVEMKLYTEHKVRTAFRNLLKVINNIQQKKLFFKGLTYKDIIIDDMLEIKISNYTICNTAYPVKEIKDKDIMMFTSPECLVDTKVLLKVNDDEDDDNYIDENNDTWKCGIILYMLLCGNIPFNGSKDNIIDDPIAFLYEDWKYISHEAIDLLKQMLKKKPDKRYSISQCLKHPWVIDNTIETQPFQLLSDKLASVYYTICLANSIKQYIKDKEELENDGNRLRITNEQKDNKQILLDYYGMNEYNALTLHTNDKDIVLSIEDIINSKNKEIKGKIDSQLEALSKKKKVLIKSNDLISQLLCLDSEIVLSIIEQIKMHSNNDNDNNNYIALDQCVKCIQSKLYIISKSNSNNNDLK